MCVACNWGHDATPIEISFVFSECIIVSSEMHLSRVSEPSLTFHLFVSAAKQISTATRATNKGGDRTDSTYTDSVFECVSALLDGEDSATELVAPSFSLSSEGGGRKDSGSADDGAGLSESISSSFKQVTDRLRACLPFIIVRLLATTIASRCTDVLRQLRGITATYRMTNKPPPTRPSPYTASILRPMMEFTDGPGFALLSRIAGFGDTLKAAVVEKVSHRFFVMADELIETVRKTESSLKKLKNRNAVGATSDSGSMSDTDKICRQLFLDVGEYARQAKEKLNVDVEKDSEAYASLARVVGGGGGENKGT